MPTDITVPTREELVRRAADLVPLLSKLGPWAEENRCLHDEAVGALSDAGLLRMRVARRFGGYESDMGTVVAVLAELARADGATSWTAAVWQISTWIVGLFPDEVQDEVFATPDVRVCGILSPTAVATPVDGGVVVDGRWAFNTGARHSHWNTNAVVLAHPDGRHEPVMTVIPLADLRIVDDWHTTALRGSGSVSTVAEQVFVPDRRVLSMGPVLAQQYSSVRNADAPVFRGPLLPTACATVGGTVLGLARAAREAFLERLPNRRITYTDYTSQREAPLTHRQVAEATVKIDEAEFHAFRAADMVDRKNAAAETWTVEERARVRLDMGAVCQRAKEAVDGLQTASGGSSIYESAPIQRITRDVMALNLHAIMHPDTNLELYGRVLCDLEPNTHYL